MALSIFLALVSMPVGSSTEHLVQSNCIPYSNSCRTFNDYASDADAYFTSDSSFHFMKGTHHLNATLFITKVVNLSLFGDESDIILSDGCSMMWTHSVKISLISLNIFYSEANKASKNSALHFEDCKAVTLLNSLFSKLNNKFYSRSRAVQTVSSSILFENCTFKNGYHIVGGALFIKNSTGSFGGHNVFQGNSAFSSGGAMYALRSQIHMWGKGTLVGNRAGINKFSDGTAIHFRLTNAKLSGHFVFKDNQHFSYTASPVRGGAIASSYSFLTMQGEFFFTNNSNNYGGGICLHDTKSFISGLVKFLGNRAMSNGGAIYASNSSLFIQGYVENSSFVLNSERLSSQYLHGAVFCNNSAGEFGGGIHLHKSNLTLTGSVMFVANRAQSGGGISIDYTSDPELNSQTYVRFQESLNLSFYSNLANQYGGAMYVNDEYLDARWCEYSSRHRAIDKCFFTISGSTIRLNFSSNMALAGGTGIYGGAIKYCKASRQQTSQTGSELLQDLMPSSALKIKHLYANFDTLLVRHCDRGATPDLHTRSINMTVQRGQVFNISVTIVGEFDTPVHERVAFTLNYNYGKTSSQIFAQPYNYFMEKGCHNLGFTILSEHQTEQLILRPPQCLFDTSILTVNIHLDDCPPGFLLIEYSCKCRESIHRLTGLTDLCDSSTGLIKCPQHDWMKPILGGNRTYEGFMWSPNCPAHLCRHKNEDNWLDFSSDNVDFLCLENHTAVLCGACIQNYSLTLSSLECSKCTSNNYLSLLLVFALAGVALIASLLFLRMTVADGTINGLIFYANIINIIKDQIFPHKFLHPNPLTVFLSWLNLDFGIPTCFFTGLNYYSYTWLQFVFPFYLWLLVGLIILACKYSARAMKLFESNPVAALATVVLMSYNKLLHTCQQILSRVTVSYSNGTQEQRWKVDPNLLYFQGKHIPLVMFGWLVVIIFLIPYVFLISFGHYLQMYSNKRGLKWLIKIKPILDAYYAPFCKNTRYWVGFLLLTRTCLSITYIAIENSMHNTILVIVASVLTGTTLILWLQHKIYQKKFVNVLEGSFITNLIVLSVTTYHVVKRNDVTHQFILPYTSIGIAFIEFLAILTFHARHRLNLKQPYAKWNKRRSCKIEGPTSSSQHVAEVKDLDRPKERVTTTAMFDIREPLLEDSTAEL